MYYFKLFLLLGVLVFLSSIKADAQPADCWDLNPCSEPWTWDNNGTNYIDVWKWQPCGDICCIKTFSLCYGSNPIGGSVNTLRISNVNWSPAPGAVCSEEGNFRRWEDNTVIPCEDGCKGSGN